MMSVTSGTELCGAPSGHNSSCSLTWGSAPGYHCVVPSARRIPTPGKLLRVLTGIAFVVLVSATSQRQGAKAPKDQQQPRVWRVVLTLAREDGQIKMTAVEFV